MRTLSKTRFQKGLQCERALWLRVHRPELATPVSEAQQWVFDQGHEVGALARGLFAGGVEVTEGHNRPDEALLTTARLLAEGATVLYEPAFEFGGAFARVDILVAAGDGRWDMYEVKSGTALKDVYVTDAAVQAYAIEGAGLQLRSVNIVRIDTAYVYTGGPYDLDALFVIDDVTDMARSYIPSIGATLKHFGEVLDGPEPSILVGSRCAHPYSCEFSGHCHSFLPAEYPVTNLPRLSEQVLHALLQAGHTCLLDIPIDFPGLSPVQRESVSAAKSGTPRVNAAGLTAALGALVWPVYHLDFETVSPALPRWAGTRPYQAIPFQYSVHVHYPDGTTHHAPYLHRGKGDPRRALAQHLIADLGDTGSIVHYTTYERTQIDGLMVAVPDLTLDLRVIRGRLFDLEPVIRNNARHPRAAGRTSIKNVLPAWCPDLSYSDLSISNGQMASARYLHVVTGRASAAEADQVFADLDEYCALDTMAMVRLLEEMLALANVERPGEPCTTAGLAG